MNTSMDMTDRHSAKAINRAIGEELRRVREALGLSRADFIKQLPSGIGERSLLAYEKGIRQLTFVRLSELSFALGTDPVMVSARGLQRARLRLDSIPLDIDLNQLLGDHSKATFRPMRQWARNTLNEHPDGVVQVMPAVVKHLALFSGCPHRDLADYLAKFIPKDSQTNAEVVAPPTTGSPKLLATPVKAEPASSGH